MGRLQQALAANCIVVRRRAVRAPRCMADCILLSRTFTEPGSWWLPHLELPAFMPAKLSSPWVRTQRHRLDLVVGDINRRRRHRFVKLLDLRAHLHAEFGVEVRQWLVKQEYRGEHEKVGASRGHFRLVR